MGSVVVIQKPIKKKNPTCF